MCPFRGGDIYLEEVYRLKHVGTGKYLSLADDKQELVLRDMANSLSTLFVFKTDMLNKTACAHVSKEFEKSEENDRNVHKLKSGERIMIQAYLDGRMLQLYEDVPGRDITQFDHKPHHIDSALLTED